MSDPILWSEIEAECGDFRAGFVATFRKYEGQPTDEKDAYNRVVKVTVASFARHVGVDKGTFGRWVKMGISANAISPRPASQLKGDVLRASRHAPDAVVAGILEAPEETQFEIYRELARSLTNKNHPDQKARRKAAEASTDEALAPVIRSLMAVKGGSIVPWIEAATEALHDMNDTGGVPGPMLDQILAAREGLNEEIEVAVFKTNMEVNG